MRGLALAAFAWCGLPTWAAGEGWSGEAGEVVGFTAPLRSATLSVEGSERIASLEVQPGAYVRAGDVLARLRDEIQRIRAEIAARSANSTLEVELARVRMEHARRELERLESCRLDLAVAAKELADARAAYESAEIEHGIARLRHELAVLDFRLQSQLLEELVIRAPFDGYVLDVKKQVGETVEEGEGIVELVQLDPLLVVLDCPLELAHALREGDCLNVRAELEQFSARQACVQMVSRAADAASQTVRVRLLMDNHDRAWMAGLKVYVDVRAPRNGVSGSVPPEQ